MMQEGGVILDIVLYVGICFVFGVFDLEIYFWCVVGCYSSTSRKSKHFTDTCQSVDIKMASNVTPTKKQLALSVEQD
jgi:hypothetical protein